MGVTIQEANGSPTISRGERNESERVWFATATAPDIGDEAAIRAAILLDSNVTDDYEGGSYLGFQGLTPITPEAWTFRSTYGDPGAEPLRPSSGVTTEQFSTAGGTSKIMQSLSTSRFPGTAPDHGGAINVSGGKVQGVDVVVPKFSFSISAIFTDAEVDSAFKAVLASLTGTVNAATFRGYAAETVLFKGANGSKRDSVDGVWEFTFEFEHAPAITNQTIAGISGVNAKGFDYIWVDYGPAEDATAESMVAEAKGVYVEKVFPNGDFTSFPDSIE